MHKWRSVKMRYLSVLILLKRTDIHVLARANVVGVFVARTKGDVKV